MAEIAGQAEAVVGVVQSDVGRPCDDLVPGMQAGAEPAGQGDGQGSFIIVGAAGIGQIVILAQFMAVFEGEPAVAQKDVVLDGIKRVLPK